jgi:hypothetical protein
MAILCCVAQKAASAAQGQFYSINSHIFVDSVGKMGKIAFRNSRHSPNFPATYLFAKAFHIQLSSLYLIVWATAAMIFPKGNPYSKI